MSEMAILEGCSQQTKDAVRNILGTFAGEDGGASFVYFCRLVCRLEAELKEGKPAAAQLLQMVYRFSTLIDASKP